MTGTPLLQPGHLEAAAGPIPTLRLAPASLFAHRARRLRHQAHNNPLGDYLHYLARLCEGQQEALDQHPEIVPPAPTYLDQCLGHQMPPLAAPGWRRHPRWRQDAVRLAQQLYDQTPAAGKKALVPVLNGDTVWIEAQAEAILDWRTEKMNLATAPVIGAALQVQWTYLARQLDPGRIRWAEAPSFCPLCGSPPVASILPPHAQAHGQRLLHCALCGSAWHRVRSQCTQCPSTRAITSCRIAGKGTSEVWAEACDECHTYLKVFDQQLLPEVDPMADDLASLHLDLLMDEQGFVKSSFNLFLIFNNQSEE